MVLILSFHLVLKAYGGPEGTGLGERMIEMKGGNIVTLERERADAMV